MPYEPPLPTWGPKRALTAAERRAMNRFFREVIEMMKRPQ